MPSKEKILYRLGLILGLTSIAGCFVTYFVDVLYNRVLNLPEGCSFGDEFCPGDVTPYWAYIAVVVAFIFGFWLYSKYNIDDEELNDAWLDEPEVNRK